MNMTGWALIVALFFAAGPLAACVVSAVFVRRLPLPRAARAVVTLAILAAGLKFVWFAVFGGKPFNPELPAAVVHALSVLHDAVVILAMFALADAGLRAVVAARRRARPRPSAPSVGTAVPRRTFLVGAFAAASGAGAALAVREGVRLPDVTRADLFFPDLPEAFDGYRIAHLSDLHVSAAARAARTAGIVERTNALGADLVVITGDFVDGAPSSRREDVAPLGGLVARDGVFGCTGNHEYYSDYGAWRSEFRRLGVRMLENAAATIRRGEDGAALALLGVNDPIGGPDLDAAAAVAPQGAFRILLAHRPISLAQHAARGVRLQLSGHTHGGAIRGLDRFVARANEGHVRGLYREHGLTLYVNAGTGQWAGFPERVGVPPEIACLTLRRGAGADGVCRAGFTASGRM